MHDLLVLSSYPEKGTIHAEKTVGGASYTKLLLTTLQSQHPNLTITVFAETFGKNETYNEGTITVQRIWQRNNIASLFSLFQTIRKRKEKTLLVSFEVYMFGSPLHTFIALLSLLLLKLQKKHIFIMMHQVVGDFNELETNPLQALYLNTAKNILYSLISFLSEKIIVFEEALEEQFGKNACAPRSEKIVVIPHSISPVDVINQKEARKKLDWEKNKKYILCFGYISPYKGIDALIDAWEEDEKTQLVIAGGINPNYIHDQSMCSYVDG